MFKTRSIAFALLLPTTVAFFALAGCGQKAPPATTTDPAVQAQIDEDAEMKAKEEELARKEAELALKEREQSLADREAALAKASQPKPRPRPAASTASTSSGSSATTAAPAPKPAVPAGPRTYTVAAGTSLSAQLPSTISTKTAKVGDRVAANLSNDLVVDGKVVAKAGALLQGSVTQVISGSKKIGGTPTLGLAFDSLVLADGSDAPVSGQITQVAAKSDTGRDAAKIAGGAVAGAILGHQVSSKNGTLIGGLLGAAA
ncbi:MAG: hypothetical protein WBO00_08595, partial [Steroidobacteraceae bacterium]